VNKLILIAASCVLALGGEIAYGKVKLEAEQRENLAIQTVELTAAQVPYSYSTVAQVLDAAPLVAMLRDLRAAQSATESSRKELERATRLYEADANMSAKGLAAARVQALTDSGRADALRAQVLTSWGPAIAAMPDTRREQLVTDLLSARVVLVRAEVRVGGRTAIRLGKVQLIASDERYTAEVLGLAANGSQATGQAYLLRVVTDSLQAGQVLNAELGDARQTISGIVVPRSAIVRWQSDDWVYIETEANHFERKLIHPVLWTMEGCLVQKELAAGQHVVTTGAALLLAAESTPAAQD
jgi:hypothetical protein